MDAGLHMKISSIAPTPTLFYGIWNNEENCKLLSTLDLAIYIF